MSKKLDPELLSAVKTMHKFYENGDIKWFDYLSDDVVVYNTTSAVPFEGKQSYQTYFEGPLTNYKRSCKVVSRTIQNMGETAILYQTIQIDQDGIINGVKQSIVWIKTSSGWKVNHIHSAVVGTPYPSKADGKTPQKMNILSEKIAAIAGVLGVAQ